MDKKWYSVGIKKSDAETIKQVMKEYRVSESKARFIIDIELGRIDGDIVFVDSSRTPL